MAELSRRHFLAGSGLLATAAAVGPTLLTPSSATAAAPRAAQAAKPTLDSAGWFQEWEEKMIDLGDRLGGTRGLDRWVDLLDDGFQSVGLQTFRDAQQMGDDTPSWNATKWNLKVKGSADLKKVPVASYMPYSGTTTPAGITAPMVYAGAGEAADFAAQDFTGKIALVDAAYPAALYETYGDWFDPTNTGGPGPQYHLYDPGNTIKLNDTWRSCFMNSSTDQVNPDITTTLAKAAGAAGIAIIFDAAPDDMLGQYLPFARPFRDIPVLYLDREAGATLKEQVLNFPTTVQFTLTADVAPATVQNLTAMMPGASSDEYIILATHLDGVGVAEENGGVALLSMARYLSQMAPDTRNRSVIFHLTYHMTPYVATNGTDFQTFHPDLYSKSVAYFGIEHLGQMNWVDNPVTGKYKKTGATEVAQLGCAGNSVLADLAFAAYRRNDLRRQVIGTNIRGVAGPHKTNMPSMGYCPLENNLVSTVGQGNLKQFHAGYMRQQMKTFLDLYQSVDATSTDELFSVGGPYAR